MISQNSRHLGLAQILNKGHLCQLLPPSPNSHSAEMSESKCVWQQNEIYQTLFKKVVEGGKCNGWGNLFDIYCIYV
jgi:hypothetical protein